MDALLQQIINGVTLGSVYALVALGYTMVYGIIGLINFAHGELVMVGALTALTVIGALLSFMDPVGDGVRHARAMARKGDTLNAVFACHRVMLSPPVA